MLKALRYQQRLERFPPILIRLLTTRGHGADKWVPTDRQLADACGLTMAEFKWVSYSTVWDEITDRIKSAYLMGCDVDLEKRRCVRRLEWMRRHGKFTHLKKSPLFETQFREMIDIWVEAGET